MTNVNGTLFFAGSGELWRSDGTEIGTVLVKDIGPRGSWSTPSDLTDVNGTAFFKADEGANGLELWKSDGTITGTLMVKDINPGLESGLDENGWWNAFSYMINVGGTLFFRADDGLSGAELWAYRQVEVTSRAYVPIIMKNH